LTELACLTGNVAKLFKKRKSTKAFDALERMMENGNCPNAPLFNRLVDVCANYKARKDAERLVEIMRSTQVGPNADTYAALFRVYGRFKDMEAIQRGLARMATDSLSMNTNVANVVLACMLSSKDIVGAKMLVKQMKADGVCLNEESFELLARLFVLRGDSGALRDTFLMCAQEDLQPTEKLCSFGLVGFADAFDTVGIKAISRAMKRRHYDPSLKALCALARMHALRGDSERVEEVFASAERLYQHAAYRDMFRSILSAYFESQNFKLFDRASRDMSLLRVVPDGHLARLLLLACASSQRDTSKLEHLFGRLLAEAGAENEKIFEGYIVGLTYCDDPPAVEAALRDMFRRKLVPSAQTYTSALALFARHDLISPLRDVLRWARRDRKRLGARASSACMECLARSGTLREVEVMLRQTRSWKRSITSSCLAEIRGACDREETSATVPKIRTLLSSLRIDPGEASHDAADTTTGLCK